VSLTFNMSTMWNSILINVGYDFDVHKESIHENMPQADNLVPGAAVPCSDGAIETSLDIMTKNFTFLCKFFNIKYVQLFYSKSNGICTANWISLFTSKSCFEVLRTNYLKFLLTLYIFNIFQKNILIFLYNYYTTFEIIPQIFLFIYTYIYIYIYISIYITAQSMANDFYT
jgi:hypothetical protein